MHQFTGILGLFVFLLVAYLMSTDRKLIPYKTVVFGLITQFVIAVVMLKTPVGVSIFEWINSAFVKVLSYSDQGSKFLFGKLVDSQDIGAILGFQVLPLIIFVSALMGILVYLGVLQFFVRILAKIFYKTLKITGIEAFCLLFAGVYGHRIDNRCERVYPAHG